MDDFYNKLFAPDMQEELLCPACGRRDLAYSGYDFRLVYFACVSCQSQYTLEGKALKKGLLYLDQWAISFMQKSTNGRADLTPWRDILRRLSNLTRNQVLLCPHSVYHLFDSELDSRIADDLYSLFKFLGGGTGYIHPYSIEANQIGCMLDALEKATPPDAVEHPVQNAFHGNPHAPSEDILIDVPWRLNPEDIAQERQTRSRALAYWEKLYAGVSTRELSHPLELAERLGRENGQDLFNRYREYVRRRERMLAGQEPLDLRPVLWAIHAREYWVVETVCDYYQRQDVDAATAMCKAEAFFNSRYYTEIPSVRIGSLLIAAVVRKYASGRKPQAGDVGDINMVRYFAPYCDSMLLDNGFYTLATESPIRIDERYRVRLFPARGRAELIHWMEECETFFLSQLQPRERGLEIPDQRLGAKLIKAYGAIPFAPGAQSHSAGTDVPSPSSGPEGASDHEARPGV